MITLQPVLFISIWISISAEPIYTNNVGSPASKELELNKGETRDKIELNLQMEFPREYSGGRLRLELEFGRLRDPIAEAHHHDQKRLQRNNSNDFPFDAKKIGLEDCNDVPYTDPAQSGVYIIKVDDEEVPVYCEIKEDGSKYLVFQRRLDGSLDFYRTWMEYEEGFGNVSQEFWLGNKILHKLTTKANYKLRVELEAFDLTNASAEYDQFVIGSSDTQYTLSISGYSGDAGESMGDHNGMKFSTKDRDNDLADSSCAITYKGAWWYKACHASNLNGHYYQGHHESYADGINWYHFRGHHESMKTTRMMISKI